MGAGVSVIASDIPGCRDLIEHGRTGLLFPVDDPAALADRIALLVADHGLRASLSAAAREHVEEHYSAARMAREYQLLYRNTCGAHDRAAETRR
jgi:glycosyltransferase involved in cell wall biosynthesis